MTNMIRTCSAFLVALAVAILAPSAQAGTITYFHNDLAGSPLAATNEQGLVVWRESYRPYGERLVNSAAASGNSVWFTSRRQDAESGLVYLGARHYDPVAGRFVSVDPAGFDEGNVHSFNRYAYGNNNPYRYKDPDGRSPITIFAIEAAKVTGLGYVIGVAADAISQGAAFGSVDWGMAATSSAAIAGGEAGLLAGVYSGASAARDAAQAARGAVRAVDPTKLNHIFGKAGHNLDDVVMAAGSREAAFGAMERGAQSALDAGKLATDSHGVFKTVVNVGGADVTVRGAVVDGVARIGSAWR